MNVAVLNPLQPVLDMFKTAFPELPRAEVSEEQRQADKEADLRDAARQEFAVHRAPALAARFWGDDDKLDAAVLYAAGRMSLGLRLALRNGDDAEFGRLLRARIALYMNDAAASAAEDEAFIAFPEVP